MLSGVTAELLKLLFPTNVEEITRRAAEQREAALLSGRATASDLAAGLALGNAVAALFTSRAATDGMRTAAGSPALFAALAAAATARGEIPWHSLESPPRPPMLAAFGNVRAWMMTPADILHERPPAPPSTSSALMAREVEEVRNAVQALPRTDRARLQVVGRREHADTARPLEHDCGAVYRCRWLQRSAQARAFALLNMACTTPRWPAGTPSSPTSTRGPRRSDSAHPDDHRAAELPVYTSGHSTFSAAAAEVLSYLFPAAAGEFQALRDEAALSRLYGGIHYRSDIEAGKDHGSRVGGYTVSFARTDGADLPR